MKRPRWSASDLANLRALYLRGDDVRDIATTLQRTKVAVQKAASKLGLERRPSDKPPPAALIITGRAVRLIDAFLRKPSGFGGRRT